MDETLSFSASGRVCFTIEMKIIFRLDRCDKKHDSNVVIMQMAAKNIKLAEGAAYK